MRTLQILGLSVLVVGACRPSPVPAPLPPESNIVQAQWSGCFQRLPVPVDSVCGSFTVTKGRFLDPFNPRSQVLYPLTHDIPFHLFGSVFKSFPPFGILARVDSVHWHLQIGLADRKTEVAFDDGSIVADDLIMDGDSLFGPWTRTCFGYCPERGTLLFRRR